MNFESIQFLNKTETEQILNSVEKLKNYWKHRGPIFTEEIPFYTLGAVEYLDLEDHSREYYEQCAEAMNPILWKEFEWLYIKLKNFFEEKYKDKFEYYSQKSALPGFHIFLDNDIFEIPLAARHCDLQFRKIDWGGMEYDKSTHLSFTLYIKLPETGGGINVWNYFFDDLKDLDNNAREELLNDADYEYKKFNESDIVIHNGFQYHQIAPIEEVHPGDKRISLQGHAIKANGTYWFHW